jgi:hypothetical protein
MKHANLATVANYRTNSQMRRAIESLHRANERVFDRMQAIRSSDHPAAEAVYDAIANEGIGVLVNIDGVGKDALDEVRRG